jgi:predicted ABC-type ATPase
MPEPPRFLILAGPNGAGKSTAARVRAGGHHIPEPVIRRRYRLGLRNFFGLDLPIADKWAVFDATGPDAPRPIAEGTLDRVGSVDDPDIWQTMQEDAGHEI